MMEPCPNGCNLQFRGVRGYGNVTVYELWECPECGRQEVRPYTGCIDTIEWRN